MAVVLLVAIPAAACSSAEDAGNTVVEELTGPAPPLPELDPALVARGEVLYQRYCASCHGGDLEGTPDWQTPNADGTYNPPPLDSDGHAWHHSDELLREIIRDGGAVPDSRMPGFANALEPEDIDALIEFLKSTWGPEERSFQARVN